MKTLNFDAKEVKTSSKSENYVNVEIETNYPDEVLNVHMPFVQKYHEQTS